MSNNSKEIPAVAAELAKGNGASVIHIVDAILAYACEARASDIHLDPSAHGLMVRVRVDGSMRQVQIVPNALHHEVIARIKIMASLRTDEHYAAQDGRFSFTHSGSSVDVRVSIMPTYYGENCIMRLLTNTHANFTLAKLGFSHAHREILTRAIGKPHGMILMTGPTGSGKTTALYALLKMLNTPEAAIVTIEDPIEYSIAGINQIQINARTGITFANGLRGILRQDPNVIMVGEIRDAETAGIAVNTALTGHLVLSTLHTNDAPTAIPRLLDLKVDAYLIASTLSVVVGQRLVRHVCEKCKIQRKVSGLELERLKKVMPESAMQMHTHGKDIIAFAGCGCDACDGTGYRGRIGIFEVMEMSRGLRESLAHSSSAERIRETALKEGMATMAADGFQKIIDGKTTVEEILRMGWE